MAPVSLRLGFTGDRAAECSYTYSYAVSVTSFCNFFSLIDKVNEQVMKKLNPSER